MKRLVPYIAVLICAGCGYLGYLGTIKVVYHHQRATWFNSLGEPDAQQLRETGPALLGLGLSSLLIQNTKASLQHNVSSLGEIRGQAPRDLWPILDLRLAKDYAVMARLEQASDSAVAASHRQMAAALLNSLGWKDVSDNAVAAVADKQLAARFKE